MNSQKRDKFRNTRKYCLLCGGVEGISVHLFPKAQLIREKWVQYCKLEEKDIKPKHSLCTNHFASECYTEHESRIFLKSDAVPTMEYNMRQKSNFSTINRSCFLCGRNKGINISSHRFPHNKSMRSLWVNACGIPVEHLKSDSRLCSKHFAIDCFGKSRRLKSDSIPSLYLPTQCNNVNKENKGMSSNITPSLAATNVNEQLSLTMPDASIQSSVSINCNATKGIVDVKMSRVVSTLSSSSSKTIANHGTPAAISTAHTSPVTSKFSTPKTSPVIPVLQSSPVTSEVSAVQTSPVTSKVFAVQMPPVASQFSTPKTSPVMSEVSAVQISPVTSKVSAVQMSPVTSKQNRKRTIRYVGDVSIADLDAATPKRLKKCFLLATRKLNLKDRIIRATRARARRMAVKLTTVKQLIISLRQENMINMDAANHLVHALRKCNSTSIQ